MRTMCGLIIFKNWRRMRIVFEITLVEERKEEIW
jgi:hypothetical protein